VTLLTIDMKSVYKGRGAPWQCLRKDLHETHRIGADWR